MASPLDFDEALYASSLTPGDKEMFLFKWLSKLDAHLEAHPAKEPVKAAQERLEAILLEIAMIPQAAAKTAERRSWLGAAHPGPARKPLLLGAVPKPTRVIRDLVAKCLARVYELGSVHQMGDALYAIQAVMAKKGGLREPRLAAFVCAGVLFEALATKAGFRLLSCFNDFLAIGLKTIKTEHSVEATRMVARLLHSKTIGEAQARDVVKTLRPNLQHKSPVLVLATVEAFEALAVLTPFMRMPAFDMEAFVAGLVGLLANPVLVVRRALARLTAVLISHSITLQPDQALADSAPNEHSPEEHSLKEHSPTEHKAMSADVSVRNSLDAQGIGSEPAARGPLARVLDDTVRSSTDLPQHAAQPALSGQLPLARALTWLSLPFARTASRELCAGIIDAYAMLISELGTTVVESHYAVILDHVLGLAADAPTKPGAHAIGTPDNVRLRREGTEDPSSFVGLIGALDARTEAEVLARRNMCGWLLRVPVGRLLTEQGKQSAVQTIWTRLKQLTTTQLLVALREWRLLVESLGEAARVEGTVVEPWLAHPNEAVRISAAACLGSMHAPVLSTLVSRFQQLCAQTTGQIDVLKQCIGYAHAISSVVARGSFELPLDLLEWVHSIATRLLGSAYQRSDPVVLQKDKSASDPANVRTTLGIRGVDVALLNMHMTAGWVLVAGLTRLDGFAAAHSAEWLPLWTAALTSGFVTASMPWHVRAHHLQSRFMALSHLLAYLRLPNPDHLKPIVACIKSTMMFADNALDAPYEDMVDPARPTWLLPTQTSILTTHMQIRGRVAECLQMLEPRMLLEVSPFRLIEQAIGTVDNLYEVFGEQIAAGQQPSQGVPHVARGITCQRGFRSGPWGYEAETGTTTLLCAVCRESAAQDASSSQQALDTVSGDETQRDFASGEMTALEFDWLLAASPDAKPPAPYVKLVDNAIQLFGRLFPLVAEQAQLAMLDTLVLRLNELPFNSHRYVAVLTNILCALYAATRDTDTPQIAPQVARNIVDMTRAGLILPSPAHRFVAGEIIGCLAVRTATTAYLPYLLDHLTREAIRSRDRFARAGAAVALGSLYARAGSIAASSSLRRVVVLLHSLASDKDPVVHTWAIAALAEAAMSAGYMFEPYARDTFQMALKLFLTDSHTVPLFASAQWLRGKEHAPSSSFDCAGRERVLPLRTATDLHMWARQAAEHSGIGNIVAVGHDAAVTHPNSTTHHGHADASELVCSCDDLDAFDARAALGHLVSSLVLVFGPELQADHTRDSVLTLLHELRRALPLGILVPSELSPIADPDARWQTVAEFIFATQKQLLFLHCGAEFVPLFLRQTLRPIVRAQEITYHGQAGGLHRLQRVAVQAMEGALRLYGGRILAALRENAGAYWADWSLCDIVWEALVLYNTVSDQLGSDDSVLLRDLRKLVQTAIGLTIGHELAQLEALCARGVQFGETGENAEGIQGILAMVETLCLVFLTRRAVPTLVGLAGHEAKAAPADVLGARPFNAATKRLVVAALVAHLDAVGPLAHSQHPLTSMLADLLRVGYIAATSDQPTLCCLGLFLLQLLIEQFGHIEDPKTHDAPILVIYEAQLNTAFMPLLSSTEPVVRRAAMNTATAYVVSGLISDRSTFVRILRLMAPQPIGKKKDTEQIKIVMRLTVLREWSVIFSFALRTHNDALMDIVNLHMPALCKMWLAAVHDTAAVTMEQASVGLELGLDAAYVGLVRERLATWYRYYLPQFLFTLSSLLTPLSVENSTKKTKQVLGHAEVLRLLDSPSCKDTKSVLLFAFALQELSAMATKDYQEPRDPFVQTVLQIGPLDLDTSFGEGKRATLYCAPGQLSHVDRIESLQRLLCALLEPPLYSKVESVLLSTSGNSWLIEAVWTHAVSKFMRMTTPVATTLDLAQGVLRHCVLVDHVQSGPRFLDGLSGFGKTVVRDIVDAWQACCSLLESGGSMANTLVAKCLDLLGTVVCASLLRTDGSSKHSLSLWLTLWHKSLFLLGEPRVAAESLGCFMRKLVGDQADVANCMVNALLVQLLSAPSEENGHAADSTTIRALSIVAWLASQDNTALEPIVSAELSSRFVSVFEAQLRAACKAALAQDSHVNTLVSTIKPVLASRTNSILTELLPRLARSSIPLLATRLHNNNNSNNSSSSNSNSEEPVLSVLCMFATAHYASAQQSTGVMAAVLMLFLSMLLPQEADLVGAKEKKNVVAKAILSMASVAPERFKPIVVRLSATQPEAKRRLELAIRSQTTHGVEHVESLDDTSKGAEPDTASKIVLKSSFGF